MSVSAYHSNFKGTQGIADARGACRAHGGEGTVLGDASRAEGAVPRGPCRGGRAAEAAYGVARHGGRAGLSQGRAGLSLQSAFGWKETKQCFWKLTRKCNQPLRQKHYSSRQSFCTNQLKFVKFTRSKCN